MAWYLRKARKGVDGMSVTRDGKLWRSQFYYEDWQGKRHKKNKRGFKTKGEAEAWERNFRQQQQRDLDIKFDNFVEIYFKDMEHRLRESTIINKRYVFDLKVTPYFKNKKICEIKTADIREWQNLLIKKEYAPTYLKSINNQLAALFNYAVRYYDLKDNPCRKAGSIGKSKADEMEFWTKQEFKEFIFSMKVKPEAKMAFLILYWTGIRIGELLALTYEDIDLEKRIISISKSYQRIKGKDMVTPPKTPKSNRKVTIPSFLAEERCVLIWCARQFSAKNLPALSFPMQPISPASPQRLATASTVLQAEPPVVHFTSSPFCRAQMSAKRVSSMSCIEPFGRLSSESISSLGISVSASTRAFPMPKIRFIS